LQNGPSLEERCGGECIRDEGVMHTQSHHDSADRSQELDRDTRFLGDLKERRHGVPFAR